MNARRMTVEQTADATGLSVTTLKLMHIQGHFRCESDGLYRAANVERLIARHNLLR